MDGRTTQPNQPRRPNGRLVACDVSSLRQFPLRTSINGICKPCRKRKLACDHTHPVCNRCRKRKQGEECVYLVSGSKISAPRSPLPSPASSARPSTSRRRTPQSTVSTPVVRSEVQAPIGRPGYLGPTSYCSVYEDAENSLFRLRGPESSTPQCDSVSHNTPVEGSRDIMSDRIRDMCLTILKNIPEIGNGVLLRIRLRNDSWIRPAAVRVAQSFYETFENYLVNRSDLRLEELARKLCINTSRPFSDDEPDTERWMSQSLGENMRWEFMGILFTFWDHVLSTNSAPWTGKRSAEFDPGFQLARKNMHLCLEVCKEFSSGNALMMYLTQRCTVVDSMFLGDASEYSTFLESYSHQLPT